MLKHWYQDLFPEHFFQALLLHDFACMEAKDMYYQVLADRVRYFKEDEKGVAVMCKAMEDMRK